MNTLLLLLDEHELCREGLAALLAQRLPPLQLLQAGSLQQAMQQLGAEARVDLIVLDPSLPDCPGPQALDRLRALQPDVPVMVLSANPDLRHQEFMRERGAAGFLSKSISAERMCDAIHAVLAWQPEPLLKRVAQADNTDVPAFTQRQLDVLKLLCDGHSNKRIGRELQMSESTVKTHLEGIFRKLGAHTRVQAVVMAGRMGLLAPLSS
jgi:DNA-binding NarL/FixJ family response regulator